jgi:type IV pilus assembly protein PilC
MSAVLADVDGFSGKLRSVLVIGEETGKLDDILTFAANSFEYDADAAITSLLELLQPLLLVIVAIIICIVIIGVLLPIFQMYESIG